MLLNSNRVFDTLAEYDPTTRMLVTFSRAAEPERARSHVSGVFDYLGGKRLVLYRAGEDLWLDIDGMPIRIDTIGIKVECRGEERLLRAFSSDHLVFEVGYELPKLDPPIADDPTPFIDEEDFDFGLFLQNIARDKSRQARIYRGDI